MKKFFIIALILFITLSCYATPTIVKMTYLAMVSENFYFFDVHELVDELNFRSIDTDNPCQYKINNIYYLPRYTGIYNSAGEINKLFYYGTEGTCEEEANELLKDKKFISFLLNEYDICMKINCVIDYNKQIIYVNEKKYKIEKIIKDKFIVIKVNHKRYGREALLWGAEGIGTLVFELK